MYMETWNQRKQLVIKNGLECGQLITEDEEQFTNSENAHFCAI